MERVIRELHENPQFRQQCGEIARRYNANERHVDDALNGLTWAISTNAEGFRTVPGLEMRVGFAFGRDPIPALKVYFKIVGEHGVELLWVEDDEGGHFYV